MATQVFFRDNSIVEFTPGKFGSTILHKGRRKEKPLISSERRALSKSLISKDFDKNLPSSKNKRKITNVIGGTYGN